MTSRGFPLLRASLFGLGAAIVLVTGCNTNTGSSVANSAYFGPGSAPHSATGTGSSAATGSFSAVAALTTARGSHSTTLLNDGRVLIVGGQGGSGAGGLHTEAEVYDGLTNTWTTVSTLSSTPNKGRMMDPTNTFPTGRLFHSAVKLVSGAVMISGGLGFDRQNAGGQPIIEALKTTYLFEPVSNEFQNAPAAPVARFAALSHLLVSGNVLVANGYNAFQPGAAVPGLKSADIFVGGGATWKSVGGTANAGVIPDGHTWGNAVQIGQQVLLLYGMHVIGLTNPQQQAALAIEGIDWGFAMPAGTAGGFAQGGHFYDEANDVFTAGPVGLRRTFPSGVILGGATTMANGNAFFAGGEDLTPSRDTRFNGALIETEVLTGLTKMFSAGPSLASSGAPGPTGVVTPIPRTEVRCVEIAGSADVLIVGGMTPTQQGPVVNPQSEVYDSGFNIMLGTTNLATGRHGHGAVKFGGNKVLVVGGLDDMDAPITSVEVFNR